MPTLLRFSINLNYSLQKILIRESVCEEEYQEFYVKHTFREKYEILRQNIIPVDNILS